MSIENHLAPVDSFLYVFRLIPLLARPKDFEEKRSILPNRLVCWLNVGDIREVCIDMDGQTYEDLLNVLWVSIDKVQAGANGHAGITGLGQENKLVRKNLRSRLADIANKNANDISRLHMVAP